MHSQPTPPPTLALKHVTLGTGSQCRWRRIIHETKHTTTARHPSRPLLGNTGTWNVEAWQICGPPTQSLGPAPCGSWQARTEAGHFPGPASSKHVTNFGTRDGAKGGGGSIKVKAREQGRSRSLGASDVSHASRAPPPSKRPSVCVQTRAEEGPQDYRLGKGYTRGPWHALLELASTRGTGSKPRFCSNESFSAAARAVQGRRRYAPEARARQDNAVRTHGTTPGSVRYLFKYGGPRHRDKETCRAS